MGTRLTCTGDKLTAHESSTATFNLLRMKKTNTKEQEKWQVSSYILFWQISTATIWAYWDKPESTFQKHMLVATGIIWYIFEILRVYCHVVQNHVQIRDQIRFRKTCKTILPNRSVRYKQTSMHVRAGVMH